MNEEYRKVKKRYVRDSILTTDKFIDSWHKLQTAERDLIGSACLYILEHYKKIKDWSDISLNVIVMNGREKFCTVTEEEASKYGSYYKGKSETVRKLLKDMAPVHNPVETITNVVWDLSDGDFSVDINGKAFLWFDDASILDIAEFININLKQY